MIILGQKLSFEPSNSECEAAHIVAFHSFCFISLGLIYFLRVGYVP